MSQHDYDIANAAYATVRADVNSAMQAAQTANSGATAPATKYVGMTWLDNSGTPWIVKRWDGTDWITEHSINATTNAVTYPGGVDLASPGAIGGTTPGTGTFNALNVDVPVSTSGVFTMQADAADRWSLTIDATEADATFALNSVDYEIVDYGNRAITRPVQPAFHLYAAAAHANNATGDGTAVTVQFNSTIKDIGSNATGTTFTAPVSGMYHFDWNISLGDMTASTTRVYMQAVFSNHNSQYVNDIGGAGESVTGSKYHTYHFSATDYMDASDTVSLTLAVTGTTKTIDIVGNSQPDCTWSGYLVG